jgi:uncharacterized protein (DUF2249 family)
MKIIETNSDALEAMLTHHAALIDGVVRRVEALRAAVERQVHYEAVEAELVDYLAKEVIPHAMAEEDTLYQAAAAKEDLVKTVAGLVDEHRKLVSLAERLASASDGSSAVADAEAIGALFTAHVAKENELILPLLAVDDAVDMAGLLVQMHRLIEAAQDETSVSEDMATSDVEATLLRLLFSAANQLADTGRGDAACKLVAEAWATVRATRPELAVRVTAVLHRLVRAVTAAPVTLSEWPLNVGGDAVLDVRSLVPAQRHEKIFATFEALSEGAGFILVNDHDPKPLRYQFEAEHEGNFTWDVLEAGQNIWRVRIGRLAGQST